MVLHRLGRTTVNAQTAQISPSILIVAPFEDTWYLKKSVEITINGYYHQFGPYGAIRF